MSLPHDLFQLFRSWWQVDRIRVSPTEGQWLRLDPPCIVFVEGTPVEVLRRTLVSASSDGVVEYECLRGGEKACLIVTTIDEKHSATVGWREEG